jgi:hypothetical protein
MIAVSAFAVHEITCSKGLTASGDDMSYPTLASDDNQRNVARSRLNKMGTFTL